MIFTSAQAQTAEAVAAAAKAADNITAIGPLGSVFIFATLVLLGALWLVWRALGKSEKEKFEISKEAVASITATKSSLTVLQTAADNANRIAEKRLEELTALAIAVAALKTAIELNTSEIRHLGDQRVGPKGVR